MTAPTRLTGAGAAAALAELGIIVDATPATAGDGADAAFSEQLLAEIVAGYLEALNAGEAGQPDYLRQVFAVDDHGRPARYLRIISRAVVGTGGSAHAFIDTRDGSLHKPGGVKGPAKNRAGQLMPRYQLSVPEVRAELFARLATGTGRHGGYLYAG